jgi:hypothetical protein
MIRPRIEVALDDMSVRCHGDYLGQTYLMREIKYRESVGENPFSCAMLDI